jgi:N-acetylglucosamine-6-sulfatase
MRQPAASSARPAALSGGGASTALSATRTAGRAGPRPTSGTVRRRAQVLLALLVLTALVAATTATSSDGTAPKASVTGNERPNIVLVLVDDMRADEMRFLPKTRRLLGRRGVTYTHAISPHPLCCPARAELITGQYAQNNDVKDNGGPWGGFQALSAPGNNIGAWMQDRGYRTGFIGKFLNGYQRGRVRGWDAWRPLVRRVYTYWRPGFFGSAKLDDGYVTHAIRRRTARAIREFDGDPFFLYIFHPAPHEAPGSAPGSAWVPPPAARRYRNHYNRYRPAVLNKAAFNERDVSDLPADLRRGYRSPRWFTRLARGRARALRSVDDSVAALVSQLDRIGALKQTYIVFTSDNGYMFGEHRLGGKNVLFDEALDVPLLARGPGLGRGVRVRRPVTLVDLPAAFVGWAGATPGRRIDGLPLTNPGRRRDTILIQTGTAQRGTSGWSYRGVTTNRYLYAYRVGHPGSGLLFDRARDPHALRNRFRATAYAAVRRTLDRRTRVLIGCSGVRDCNRSFGPVPRPR